MFQLPAGMPFVSGAWLYMLYAYCAAQFVRAFRCMALPFYEAITSSSLSFDFSSSSKIRSLCANLILLNHIQCCVQANYSITATTSQTLHQNKLQLFESTFLLYFAFNLIACVSQKITFDFGVVSWRSRPTKWVERDYKSQDFIIVQTWLESFECSRGLDKDFMF